MLTYSRPILGTPTVTNNNLSNFLSPLNHHFSSLSTNFTLKRGFQQIPKRPICPNCSKPITLCLCTRLKTPNLDNEVHITILQHRLERKHPLNSARIAKIGLRNVDVVNVSDVIFDAQFVIRPLGLDYELGLVGGECMPGACGNASESLESDGYLKVNGSRKRGFRYVDEVDSGTGSAPSSAFDQLSSFSQEDTSGFCFGGDDGELAKEDDRLLKKLDDDVVLEGRLGDKLTASGDDLMSKDAKKCNLEPVICMAIGSYGIISSGKGNASKCEHFLASPETVNSLQRGFMVKKLQKKQKHDSTVLEQFEEFDIKVPPGSALLFPAKESVPFEAVDFEIKNLIVLDGTWAKAKRMYNENPWLRVLPAVRLDVEKASLFSEVRPQPKPGYLSTIESIVYALKGLGGTENLNELDNLLDVFESMVEDQRRCMDERPRNFPSVYAS